MEKVTLFLLLMFYWKSWNTKTAKNRFEISYYILRTKCKVIQFKELFTFTFARSFAQRFSYMFVHVCAYIQVLLPYHIRLAKTNLIMRKIKACKKSSSLCVVCCVTLATTKMTLKNVWKQHWYFCWHLKMFSFQLN